ncbi:MAG: peptidylprolyl isomerase [Hydrogenophilales bacterium 16-61-112]|nr:MAG: peptidylprolyl isomerase [Hydrogenophilales bacterium 16-61-112]
MTAAAAHFDATQGVLIASGAWRVDAAAALPRLDGHIVRVLDGTAITQLDTNGAWLLLNAVRPQPDDPLPELRGFQPRHLSLLNLVAEHAATTAARIEPPRAGLLETVGRSSYAVARHISGLVRFIGQLTLELGQLIRKPENWRWRELGAQVSTVFVGAIPIVIGMMFLLGVVFAYLLGSQAQQYGAAITAQLGTMKVNEEIDAITTLGLSPLAVLVIPRILALLIALPLLVFIGDIAGVIGGMLVAQAQLDISTYMFVDRMESVLRLKTLMVGILKGPVFAVFIALIACRMGLSVSRDASSVGAHTTSTVVQSLVAIIILNAIFAVMFVRMDI